MRVKQTTLPERLDGLGENNNVHPIDNIDWLIAVALNVSPNKWALGSVRLHLLARLTCLLLAWQSNGLSIHLESSVAH